MTPPSRRRMPYRHFHHRTWLRHRLLPACCALLLPLLVTAPRSDAGEPGYWASNERSSRVLAITPGRSVPKPGADQLLKKETDQLLKQWEKEHGAFDAAASLPAYATREPADAILDQHLPSLISPYARLLEGTPQARQKTHGAMTQWCPLYDAALRDTRWDPARPLEVRLSTGITLYSEAEAYPESHPFRPTYTVKLPDLDGNLHSVPAAEIHSPDGSRWEVYPTLCVDAIRWKEMGATAIGWLMEYQKTGDPFYVHKIAHYLDKAADIYYRLPLSYGNELAKRPDGKPLDRETWESLPTSIFKQSIIGHWNRHTPNMNRGWISIRSSSGLYRNDLTWIEPFAFTRHHPAFRQYSLARYNDPDALDRKVNRQILREVAHLFKTGTGHIWQGLIQNYQNADYSDLYLLGVLLADPLLIDFAAPANEVTLYNHHHYDGMTGEGAPNYMAMLSHYYRNLLAPDGWPLFDPGFLQRNPFFKTANESRARLSTVRNLPLEIGDQHIYAWPATVSNARNPSADPETISQRESVGSENWPGFGVGILRAGAPGQRLESSLSYTRQVGHSKSDIMGIDLWMDGIPIIRRGGYASKGQAIALEAGSKESEAVNAEKWPHPPFSIRANDGVYWFRGYASSPILQNTLLADETATMTKKKGLPQLVRFWPGHAGKGERPLFQAIEAVDRTSFERIGVPIEHHGRTLLAVEGRSGRAYLVDITTVKGKARTRLFTGIWGAPDPRRSGSLSSTDAGYPDFQAAIANENHAIPATQPLTEAESPWWNGGKVPARFFEALTSVQSHPPSPVWDRVWRTDYNLYSHGAAKRESGSGPLEGNTGKVGLHLFGVNPSARHHQLYSAKGPWAARIVVPMKEHGAVNGNVGFKEAISYIIECASATKEQEETTFVHVMEGLIGDQPGEIRTVRPLAILEKDDNPGTVALEIQWKSGDTDTVIYHPGSQPVSVGADLSTDARYTLVRRDAEKKVVATQFYEGSRLAINGLDTRKAKAALTGTLVDLKGDITGFRGEAVLIIRPETDWKDPESLSGLSIEVQLPNADHATSDFYTIEKATLQPDGLLALQLAGTPPFARGWHQVSTINPEKPHEIASWRPFWLGMNSLLYHGAKAYFPRNNRTLKLTGTQGDGGDAGSRITAWFDTGDLGKEEIQIGDWFLIHDIEPGCKVVVPLSSRWSVGGSPSPSQTGGHAM